MNLDKTFESRLAGRWYAEDRQTLTRELEAQLPTPVPPVAKDICAIVVPHAGYAYSGRIAANVYARLDPGRYDRVVIMGPSHYAALPNMLSIIPASGFRTPLGTSPSDADWIRKALELPGIETVYQAHTEEHSDQIQIPMIQHFLGMDKKLVCLVVGVFDPEHRMQMALGLRELLDERTLLVASTDFTHYGPNFGYEPFGNTACDQVEGKLKALDGEVFEAFASWRGRRFSEVLKMTGATVCGREVLSLLLDLKPSDARVVQTAYGTSGELTDDWTNSVSYVGAVVKGSWATDADAGQGHTLKDEDSRLLLEIARESIACAAATKSIPPERLFAARLTPGVQKVLGGFVTLTLDGQLRGCIGEIEPSRPIWKVVREQAVNAAIHDPRFEPVQPEEVPFLEIEISALSPPRTVLSWKDIEVGRHGVVMAKAGCSAVFLPQVAPEQGWDRETMLGHLARKAGLPPEAWRKGAALSVFEAQVFHEPRR